MSNYYDMLKIEPAATPAEIEAALEAQYNQCRRLVIHHDPTVVNQANQRLQTLEQIRYTLLNPQKRAAYDRGLGLGQVVGGLSDPAAAPMHQPAVAPTPPPPLRKADVQQMLHTHQRVDAWLCPKCATANTTKTRFCKKCGQVLGQDCPKCKNLLEAQAQFCPDCGVNIVEYRQELERAEAERQAAEQARQRQLAEEARIKAALKPIASWANQSLVCSLLTFLCLCMGWIFIIPFFFVPFLLAWSIFQGVRVLRAPQYKGVQSYRNQAVASLLLTTLAGLGFFFFIGLWGFTFLMPYFS